MLTPPRYIIGKLPDGSERWAAIDPNAHYLQSRIAEKQFGAYLAPFLHEDAARHALLAAGAVNIEAEAGKRGRRG